MKHFLPHHLSYHIFPQILIDVQINRDFCWWVTIRIIKWGHVGVLKCFSDTNSIWRVENKHLLEQINGQRISVWIKTRKGGPTGIRERFNVSSCFWVIYERKIFLSLASKYVNYQFKLIETLCAWKEKWWWKFNFSNWSGKICFIWIANETNLMFPNLVVNDSWKKHIWIHFKEILLLLLSWFLNEHHIRKGNVPHLALLYA